MKTAQQLKATRQKLARSQLALARQRDQVRKVDTRRKIQLGGLMVKAGLDEESAAMLLGLLISAKKKLADVNGEKLRQQWQILGQQVFENTNRVTDIKNFTE